MSKLKNATFLEGDAGERLRDLPAETVQTAVTSPPYWGLRDYGESGQIGLEENVNDFIHNLCDILDEVGRVLRPDGTLWLNMGDSYFGGGRAQGKTPEADEGEMQESNTGSYVDPPDWSNASDVLKPKDQCLVPHRTVIELQERGWYLRSTVVWHKKTAMPESVKDRPTNAHEYFFLLSKNEQYFYDHFAIKEPMVTGGEGSLKNKRDVWSLSGGSFSGEHFATFPKDLVEPPILASTSEKGQCAECGTPIKRIVEKGDVAYEDAGDRKRADAPGSEISKGHNSVFQEGVIFDEQTAGWERQCDCDTDETEPQIVLDPFQGSGTTGIVAMKHGRRFVGIDLSEKFINIAKERIRNDEDVPVNHTFW